MTDKEKTMQDLTKSMMSFSWAMTLFGANQAANMLMPRDPASMAHQASSAFDSLTQAATSQMGQTFSEAFKSGDQAQRAVVDMMFGSVSQEAFDPARLMKTMTDAMGRMAGAGAQAGQQAAGQ